MAPYSPNLDPDELVWIDAKNHGVGRKMIVSPLDLNRAVHSRLRRLQRDPEKVRSFFQTDTTRYAEA